MLRPEATTIATQVGDVVWCEPDVWCRATAGISCYQSKQRCFSLGHNSKSVPKYLYTNFSLPRRVNRFLEIDSRVKTIRRLRIRELAADIVILHKVSGAFEPVSCPLRGDRLQHYNFVIWLNAGTLGGEFFCGSELGVVHRV